MSSCLRSHRSVISLRVTETNDGNYSEPVKNFPRDSTSEVVEMLSTNMFVLCLQAATGPRRNILVNSHPREF